MKKKDEFQSKKKYFKDRQLLYEQMKSLKELGQTVKINGKTYEKVEPDFADHIFIWFDRKPMICFYNAAHKGYVIGDFQFHISNPNKKTNQVIEFVRLR